jgi:hypothetical protein
MLLPVTLYSSLQTLIQLEKRGLWPPFILIPMS